MTFATGTWSDLPDFGSTRLPQNATRGFVFGALRLCFVLLAATWIVSALEGTPREHRQFAPHAAVRIARPHRPIERVASFDPNLVFSNLGATSSFVHEAIVAPSFDRFEPAKPIAKPASGPSSSSSAAPKLADIPLPPKRDISIPPMHEVRVSPVEIPLPPARPPMTWHVNAGATPSAGTRMRSAARATPALTRKRLATRTDTTARAPAIAPAPINADNRNFFQKLFNLGADSSSPALAYARSEGDGLTGELAYGRAGTAWPYGAQTAIYDITAHTVYMPDGERLEAHSGLGNVLDDPNAVSEKDRGPTPPHAYDLTLRKRLFHGVQALRLEPVGSGPMYGRDGLLAHTYMLGANGQSNGCVSFKHYSKFLRAFLNGDVRRLVVVTHLG